MAKRAAGKRTPCSEAVTLAEDFADRGMIPRVIERLFADKKHRVLPPTAELYFTFVEIYNEGIYDLFQSETPTQRVKQVAEFDEQIKALRVERGSDVKSVFDLFLKGAFMRKTRGTNSNELSSRSHCVFTVYCRGGFTRQCCSDEGCVSPGRPCGLRANIQV